MDLAELKLPKYCGVCKYFNPNKVTGNVAKLIRGRCMNRNVEKKHVMENDTCIQWSSFFGDQEKDAESFKE